MILLIYKLMCDFIHLFVNIQFLLFFNVICRLEDCGAFKSNIDSMSDVIGAGWFTLFNQ